MSIGSDLSQVEIGLAVAAGTAVGSGVWQAVKSAGARAMKRWRYRDLDRKTRKMVTTNPGPVWIPYYNKIEYP